MIIILKRSFTIFLLTIVLGMVGIFLSSSSTYATGAEMTHCDQVIRHATVSVQISWLKKEQPAMFKNAKDQKKEKMKEEKPEKRKGKEDEEEKKKQEQENKEATPPSSPSPASPPSSSSLSALENSVVQLVNKERAKKGLGSLTGDAKLSSIARTKSQNMIDKKYFAHQSPTYGSPFNMLKQFGISYKKAAENIAAGQSTAEGVVASWMKSPGHRANILDPDMTRIGVGHARGGKFGHYWTQLFTK